MAKKEAQPKAHPSDSREALLHAARRVFALKGYEGATVKDLADEAGVNVSLISYHFGGKESLYRTCMESFGLERVEAAERILRAPISREDFKLRLRLFGEEFIEIHIRDSEVCTLVHRGMEACDPLTMDIFKSVFIRIFEALHNFMKAAQESGLLRSSLNPEITAALAFGALTNMLRGESFRQKAGLPSLYDASFRESVLDHWVDIACHGVFAAGDAKNESK